MIYSVQQTKFDIFAHVKEFEDPFERWYISASADPTRSLGERIGAAPSSTPWLYREMLTYHAARTVVAYFTSKLGTAGELPGAFGEADRFVYAYRLDDKPQSDKHRSSE